MFFYQTPIKPVAELSIKVGDVDVMKITSDQLGTYPSHAQLAFTLKKNHSFRRNKRRLAKQGIAMSKISKG